jgi:hypothetical protein
VYRVGTARAGILVTKTGFSLRNESTDWVYQHGTVLPERRMVAGQDDHESELEVDALATSQFASALEHNCLILLEDDRGLLEP